LHMPHMQSPSSFHLCAGDPYLVSSLQEGAPDCAQLCPTSVTRQSDTHLRLAMSPSVTLSWLPCCSNSLTQTLPEDLSKTPPDLSHSDFKEFRV
jgi:hypothetical protein